METTKTKEKRPNDFSRAADEYKVGYEITDLVRGVGGWWQ